MGTMRKMEDPPTEEKMTVTTESVVSNTESYDVANREASNGQERRSDRRKEMMKVKDEQRRYQRDVSNGRKQKRRKERRNDSQKNSGKGNVDDLKQVAHESEEEKYSEEEAAAAAVEKDNGHRSEDSDGEGDRECLNGMGDVPIDLSKRAVDDESQRKFLTKKMNGDSVCDTRVIMASDNDEMVTEEPLNLSRNGGSVQTTHQPLDVSSLSPTVYHRHSCSRSNLGQSKYYSSTSGSSESLQKRVRLEEMVSYIRRCSTADGKRSGLVDDGCPLSLHSCCDVDTYGAAGCLGPRQTPCDMAKCIWDEQESCGALPPRSVVKRSDSCLVQSTSPVTLSSYHPYHRHSHRRKSSVPYRGVTPSSKKPKRSRPISQAIISDDFPKDLRTTSYNTTTIAATTTTATTPTHTKEGVGSVTYPVLRQQLLGLDAPRRRGGTLSRTTRSNGSGEDEENEYVVDDDEDDDVRTLDVDQNDDGKEDNEKGSEDDDEHDGGDDLSTQQTRLSSPVASTPGLGPSRFPWTAYAYYANLFQELQGSLSSSPSNVAASTVPMSFPLSLTLIPSENRAESPASDDGPDATSPTQSAPGVVVVDCGGADNSTNSTGSGGGGGAGFRKRAPRALTGKHVKHGTGASPATLLTLRQKIEQKRRQQQQHHHHHLSLHQAKNGQSTTTSTVRSERKSTENNGISKSLKTSSLSQKKTTKATTMS